MIAAMQKENSKEEKVTEKFSIISNRISDYRLRPRDYAVYCCLVKHSDKNGVCFPLRRLIAEECCIDKKTLDAAIRSLEKAGLVKKKKRRRQDGKRCRDRSLHEEKYLKENMEYEFGIREIILGETESESAAEYAETTFSPDSIPTLFFRSTMSGISLSGTAWTRCTTITISPRSKMC